MTSCKENISCGTSISIKNELDNPINVTLYPKQTPFEYQTELIINNKSNSSFYWTSENDVDILKLLNSVYDSILITVQTDNIRIVFSSDTAKNCSINPYKDLYIWKSEIIKGDEPDSFSRNPTETENFYFDLSEENIIE